MLRATSSLLLESGGKDDFFSLMMVASSSFVADRCFSLSLDELLLLLLLSVSLLLSLLLLLSPFMATVVAFFLVTGVSYLSLDKSLLLLDGSPAFVALTLGSFMSRVSITSLLLLDEFPSLSFVVVVPSFSTRRSGGFASFTLWNRLLAREACMLVTISLQFLQVGIP